jgi:hypothetical protein
MSKTLTPHAHDIYTIAYNISANAADINQALEVASIEGVQNDSTIKQELLKIKALADQQLQLAFQLAGIATGAA